MMTRYPTLSWALLLMILPGSALIALSMGKYPIALPDLLAAFTQTGSDAAVVLWNLRLPRILAALLIGASLSAAGAAYQGMFRNPLVAPDILGVSAGASLGAILAIFSGLSLLWVQILAFAGGLMAVAMVYALSQSILRHDPVLVLVLAGIALSALLGAGISLIKILADPYSELPTITFWLLGGLNGITLQDLAGVAPLILAALVPLWLLRWRINLLCLSDDEATSLGLNVRLTRLLMITCATMITASAVAISGIIGWVGLIVPHLARLLVGPEFSRLLPASLMIGAVFLVLADTLARSLTQMELPLGVVTAFVGAPFFLFLLAQTGRRP